MEVILQIKNMIVFKNQSYHPTLTFCRTALVHHGQDLKVQELYFKYIKKPANYFIE
jgi:hypothetical protein